MSERGFSLVELLVTVVIVGILASAALPMAELAVQRGKEQDLRQALREMRNAIDAYKQAGDDGRIARQPTESGYPHSLDELVNGVTDAKDPKGGKLYFLRKIPVDPFAEATDKTGAAAWGLRCYASSRDDPKDGADVFDVYSRAPGRGLNDVPYREW